MGEKDVKAGEYLADNARFADICNFRLYGGRKVIRPEELRELDSAEKVSFERKRKKGSTAKVRDLLKNAIIRKTGTCTIAIIGIENQSDIHYAMPVRNLFYDCINYARQIKKISQSKKEEKAASDAEFLSGFGKEDRLKPVITITIYWGTEEWDGPRDLHSMLEVDDKELLKYIDNYHLKLVEPLRMTKEDFGKFRTDIKQVFQILHLANDKDGTKKLLNEDEAYQNLEEEAVSVIETFVHVKLKRKKEEKRMNVCKAWEDYKLEGVEEGIKEGKTEVAEKMLKRGKMTLEEIMEDTGLDLDILKELKEKMRAPV